MPEGMMARKPNYDFERRGRDRLKAEKKALRAAEKKAARDKNEVRTARANGYRKHPIHNNRVMARPRYRPMTKPFGPPARLLGNIKFTANDVLGFAWKHRSLKRRRSSPSPGFNRSASVLG